jgi:hypothetical protein
MGRTIFNGFRRRVEESDERHYCFPNYPEIRNRNNEEERGEILHA